MLFNDIKPMHSFIIPDLLNNSGLHNFSKGYIYNISVNGLNVDTKALVTRRGKEGKPKVSQVQFSTVPFVLKELLDHKSLYKGSSFIFSCNVSQNLLNIGTFDFICWALAKYLSLAGFTYCKHYMNKHEKQFFTAFSDSVLRNDNIPTQLLGLYAKGSPQRVNMIDHLLMIEQFSRHDVTYNLTRYNLFEESLSSYMYLVKEYEEFAKLLPKITAFYSKSKEEVTEATANIHKETNDVLQQYKNCSYWI